MALDVGGGTGRFAAALRKAYGTFCLTLTQDNAPRSSPLCPKAAPKPPGCSFHHFIYLLWRQSSKAGSQRSSGPAQTAFSPRPLS